MCQTKTHEIENSSEIVVSRRNDCEKKSKELKDWAAAVGQLFKDILKTRKGEKWIQHMLDDTDKTSLRSHWK